MTEPPKNLPISKPNSFSELFQQAERHEDYWVAGAIIKLTEGVVREMERQSISRTELAVDSEPPRPS